MRNKDLRRVRVAVRENVRRHRILHQDCVALLREPIDAIGHPQAARPSFFGGFTEFLS